MTSAWVTAVVLTIALACSLSHSQRTLACSYCAFSQLIDLVTAACSIVRLFLVAAEASLASLAVPPFELTANSVDTPPLVTKT